MYKIIIIIFLLFSIAFTTSADERIVDFSDDSLPVLNEELRKVGSNIRTNATDIDTNTTAIDAIATIPSNVIVMWSGAIADIPTGWVLCDGNNSTPDLTNRFIVGADADDGGVAKTTLTGVATQSGASNFASHDHDLNKATGAAGSDRVDATGGIGGTFTTTTAGSGTETYPTYFALAYIMKS